MMDTITIGYFIAAYGPHLSDSSENDVAIQRDILIKIKDGILN